MSRNSLDQLVKIIYDYSDSVYFKVQRYNKTLKSLHKPQLHWGMIDSINTELLYSPPTNPVIIISNQTPNFQLPEHVKIFSMKHWWYGFYYFPKIPRSRTIERDFGCFMNRLDPLRQNLFYDFYKHNLLDRGYVSLNLHYFHPSSPPTLENALNTFDLNHTSYLTSFDTIKDEVKKLVPYKNFEDTGNLADTMIKTKMNIVLESYFERPDCLTFSEKTFRVLQLPRPWLLFHATGAVDYLRSLDFDVFDDFVDHSYDSIDTLTVAAPKLDKIFSQAQQLMDLTVTDSMFDVWEQKANHNRQLLFELHQQAMEKSMSAVEQAFEYAMSC
jgi:hypothetical protein